MCAQNVKSTDNLLSCFGLIDERRSLSDKQPVKKHNGEPIEGINNEIRKYLREDLLSYIGELYSDNRNYLFINCY